MEYFLLEFVVFVELLVDQLVVVVEYDWFGICDGYVWVVCFKCYDIVYVKFYVVIFLDCYCFFSFLYIEYIDIFGGVLIGYWNVLQIIN